MDPSASNEPRSAAHYLRDNVLVGVSLCPDIKLTGKLLVPNSKIRRSSITQFRSPDGLKTGHDIEICMELKELGRLAWPKDPEKAGDARLEVVGDALSLFLAEGTNKVSGLTGFIQTFLKDAEIEVRKLKGSEHQTPSGWQTVPYIRFKFRLLDQVRDVEERVLQLAHPIRRLNHIFDMVKEGGYALAFYYARDLYSERFGTDFVQQESMEQEAKQKMSLFGGPWVLSERVSDPKEYLKTQGLLKFDRDAKCFDGKSRYEHSGNIIKLRLDIETNEVPNIEAAKNLTRALNSFIKDQQDNTYRAFYQEEEDVNDLEDANLGKITASLIAGKGKPFSGYIELTIELPELEKATESDTEYDAILVQQKKTGLLLEQLGMSLKDFLKAFRRTEG